MFGVYVGVFWCGKHVKSIYNCQKWYRTEIIRIFSQRLRLFWSAHIKIWLYFGWMHLLSNAMINDKMKGIAIDKSGGSTSKSWIQKWTILNKFNFSGKVSHNIWPITTIGIQLTQRFVGWRRVSHDIWKLPFIFW